MLGLLNDSFSQQPIIDNDKFNKNSPATEKLNASKEIVVSDVEDKENVVEEVDQEPLDSPSIRRLTMDAGSTPCPFRKVSQRKSSHRLFIPSNDSFVHNSDAILETSTSGVEKLIAFPNIQEVSDIKAVSPKDLYPALPSIPSNDSNPSSVTSEDDEDDGSLQGASRNRRLTMNAGVTPGPVTRSRGSRKKSHVTPPLAKLRPRTPCSRSTRRSKLAHCDDVHLNFASFSETPTLRKKKSKKSVTLSTKVVLIESDSNEESKQEHCINGKKIDIVVQNCDSNSPTFPSQGMLEFNSQISTPTSSSSFVLKDSDETTPVTLPWVTKCRGSSSMRRNLKKTGHLMNDLEMMFSDVAFGNFLFHYKL